MLKSLYSLLAALMLDDPLEPHRYLVQEKLVKFREHCKNVDSEVRNGVTRVTNRCETCFVATMKVLFC